MKKTIIKTALITLISAIALLVSAYFLIGAVSPLTVAKFHEKAGNERLAVKYYEKQYNKSESISDLVTLCKKLDVKNVDKKGESKAENYLKILLGKEDYMEYCELNSDKKGISTKEFFDGQYVLAVYYKSGIDNALDCAKSIVNGGYTAYNPFYVLICEAEELSLGEKIKIAQSIEDLSLTNEYTSRDLALLG